MKKQIKSKNNRRIYGRTYTHINSNNNFFKCARCGIKIKKGEEAYRDARILCQQCWEETRKKKNTKVSNFWSKWVMM